MSGGNLRWSISCRRKFKQGISLLYHGYYHSNNGINIYIYTHKHNVHICYCPTRAIAIICLLYEFRVTIGTGNNERAITSGQ